MLQAVQGRLRADVMKLRISGKKLKWQITKIKTVSALRLKITG